MIVSSGWPANIWNRTDHVFSTSRRVLVVLGLISIARLAVAALYPPLDDEAYYWTWARHLAWGYPDHPPMIAYVVRATTALAGDTAFGIRLGPTLLALGTSVLLGDLVRRMFNPAAGAAAGIWSQLIPVLSLSAVFAAPDAPLGLFWFLTLWCFWHALTSGRILAWLATGVALGLALMSKLPAVFLAVALPAFLLTSPVHRRWLWRPELYLAAVAALVVLPLIVWNTQHHWLLVRKSSNPAPWTELGSWGLNLLSYTVAQLGYYGPVAFVLLLLALATAVRWARRGDPRFALAAWAGIPIIALTWLGSFQGISKPHWAGPGYLVALIPGTALWTELRARRIWRVVVGAALALNILIIVALHAFPLRPTPSLAGELWGWDQVASRLEADLHATPSNRGVFVFTPSYQSAAQIEYHTRGRVLVTTLNPQDAIGIRRAPETFAGWNAIFATDAIPLPVPLALECREVQRLPALEVTYNGQVVRRFSIYRCSDFRPLPPLATEPQQIPRVRGCRTVPVLHSLRCLQSQ
ncbi:MAG TPA: glycosyltransferase family 39 protein [bacterium]|nr:glycosyltransferase family 39 protein [bacterium]